MRQKGFATIFALCLVLVIALIVKGIQESEANHAREVLNFELEQALQHAAESGIVEAAEKVRRAHETSDEDSLYYLQYSNGIQSQSQKHFPTVTKTFKRDEKTINITVETWGERGKIYFYKKVKEGNTVKSKQIKEPSDGVYIMSCATIKGGVLGEDIYRRAYGYVLSEKQEDDTYIDGTTITFMELPTQDGYYVTKEN